MKRYLFLMSFLILLVISGRIFADETSDTIQDSTSGVNLNNKKQRIISFRFLANFSVNPYVYSPYANSNGNGINWSAIAGVRVRQVTIAAGTRMSYVSFNSASAFGGAWNIISGGLYIFYNPRSWFELFGGIGASWFSSSFAYKTAIDMGVEHKSEVGLSLDFNLAFIPWKYITLKTPMRLDLFFDSTRHMITPYFYGAVRVDFHPYFEWLSIYIELGGEPWIYSGNYFTVQTGHFVWALGTAIDFDSIKTIRSVRTLKAKS